jgi:hypothetical protein
MIVDKGKEEQLDEEKPPNFQELEVLQCSLLI